MLPIINKRGKSPTEVDMQESRPLESDGRDNEAAAVALFESTEGNGAEG